MEDLLKSTDYADGVEQMQKLAEEGHERAQYNMGVLNYQGKGVPRDYQKAAEWFLKAAGQGHAHAQNYLGVMYKNGKGVSQDAGKAAQWFQKAAEQGNMNAQYNLAMMYEEGKGVTQDVKKAAGWYEKAAVQGNAAAQNALGIMYYNGKGVPQDNQKAAEWFQKSAEQGRASAQYNLGMMYYNGKGVPRDNQKAVEWFWKAAEQGHLNAQYNLGAMYDNGYGVSKDINKAVEWFQKAAEQGHAEAKKRLEKLQERKNAIEPCQSATVSYRNPTEQGVFSKELDRRALKIYLRNVLAMECMIYKFTKQEVVLSEKIKRLESNNYYESDNYYRAFDMNDPRCRYEFFYNGKKYFVLWTQWGGCVDSNQYVKGVEGTRWVSIEDVLSRLNEHHTWYFKEFAPTIWSDVSGVMKYNKEKSAKKKHFLKCVEEFKKTAPVEYEKNCKIRSELIQKRTKLRSDMKEAKMLLERMYQANIVPGLFRNNLTAIYYLHDLITTSNLSFDMAILNVNLEEIKAKLDRVIEQQHEMIINQNQIIAQNDELCRQNRDMLKNLESIERNTELVAQYSKITATNTDTLVYLATH